jgi:centrosomal protein CEP104
VTLDRLRTLEAAKDRAVQGEDFEEARRLKEAIERLKIVGSKLR